MEAKTYTIIGLSLLLLTSLGFNVTPEPTHKCDSRELKAYCFYVSSTDKTCYTLPNYKGAKRCTEGWKELKVDIESIPRGLQYLCDNRGCTVIV